MGQLVLESVAKIFPTGRGYTTAVYDLNLEISDGEFVCVLGASGCGKTTVLNLVAGFTTPTYGSIKLDGEEVRGPGPDRGVVFQQHAVFPWMTVEENVAFGPQLRGMDKTSVQSVVKRQLLTVGLWDFREQWPKALSGGMKQRVAIARALANEPKVLLMDEPFAALDAQTRRRMQSETERIWQQTKRTTMFVTHSIDEAILLADRIILMRGPGRGIQVFDVPLPRPRDDNAGSFVELRRVVESALNESVDAAKSSTTVAE